MRENAEVKARRYLTEGRVRVLAVHDGRAFARVRGAGLSYDVEITRAGWRCDCAARGPCAHVIATQLIVDLGAPKVTE